MPLTVVFIGSSRFGLRCLELACELEDLRVVGVVTAPETFVISYRPEGVTNVLHADVPRFAAVRGLPCVELTHGMNDPNLFETAHGWKPDAFLVAGWYHMIPKRWRALAPAYGLHASLLPDYSGGAPLVWAMINGETKTGITLFQMDDGVDSGPIVAQAEEPIHARDTIDTLYARVEKRGLELLREALPALAKGAIHLQPQDESRRRVMPQRSPADGRIDWNSDAQAVDRFIRAQTRPYPGAFTNLHGRPLTIWASSPDIQPSVNKPGHVTKAAEAYRVACATGSITLNEVTYDNKPYAGAQLTELLAAGGQMLGG